jgi:hypothetical protein
MRPVVRICGIAAWPVGGGGPGRPPEECRDLALLVRIGERAAWNGVFVPSIPEDVGVVAGQIFEDGRAFGCGRNGAGGGIVSVGALVLYKARFRTAFWSNDRASNEEA